MSDLDAVVYGANEIAIGPETDSGPGFEQLRTVGDGAVAIVDGAVATVGPTAAVVRAYPPENAATAIDAAGKAVIPGFVDSHTHALFAGDRSDEFAAKLRGRTYQELMAEGGGILRTVGAVRDASDAELLADLLDRLDTMLSAGTTTVEVKSGYGLDTDTELRMLAVIARADDEHPVDVVPTFMGAHAVPEGDDAEGYTRRVLDRQLPAVADQGIAAFCDVFCEEGAFTVEQSRRLLTTGQEYGLRAKIHAEEFAHLGGARLAAELGAASADHLLQATAADAEALAEAGVTPVLLPGTAFSVGSEYADPGLFRDRGAPIAVASDFNPNCHAPTMPFAVTLACVEMGLTPETALVSATRGGALASTADHDRAVAPDSDLGTLREGAPGDLVVLDAPSSVHVPYRFGEPIVDTVLKAGRVVATPSAGVDR